MSKAQNKNVRRTRLLTYSDCINNCSLKTIKDFPYSHNYYYDMSLGINRQIKGTGYKARPRSITKSRIVYFRSIIFFVSTKSSACKR